MQRHRLDDPVALVEDAEHSDTLGHRRYPALAIRGGADLPPRQRRILILALAARGERKRNQQGRRGIFHAYSGIQGS
jgi:hypothetical protein